MNGGGTATIGGESAAGMHGRRAWVWFKLGHWVIWVFRGGLQGIWAWLWLSPGVAHYGKSFLIFPNFLKSFSNS